MQISTTGNWRPAFDERVLAFERAFPLPATLPRPDIVYLFSNNKRTHHLALQIFISLINVQLFSILFVVFIESYHYNSFEFNLEIFLFPFMFSSQWYSHRCVYIKYDIYVVISERKMPPKTPTKGSKIISKQAKSGTSKAGASVEKKGNKRKRSYFFSNTTKYSFDLVILNR